MFRDKMGIDFPRKKRAMEDSTAKKITGKIKTRMLPVFCLAAFLCASCEKPYASSKEENSLWKNEALSYMEDQPVIAYTLEEENPNILVDRWGYQAEGGKCAFIKGKDLPDFFRLVDADSHKTVYVGRLQNKGYRREQELFWAEADFGSWTTEGNYYIECDDCGRSYSFCIRKDCYETHFKTLTGQVMESCMAGQASVTAAGRMLQAYEWYPEVFPDDNGDGIPDALRAIAVWTEQFREQEPAMGDSEDYVAVLAKFSFLYQNYDKEYATECVKRASVLYDRLTCPTEEKFQALAELYRATGLSVYGNRFSEYQSVFQGKTEYTEEQLYGAMTYLCTRQKVEASLCRLFVDFIVESGESVGDQYRGWLQNACFGESILQYRAMMRMLSCADYIANNYAYNQALEGFWHYYGGTNQKAENFYEKENTDSSEYLILVTQLLAVQKESDQSE